MLFSLPPPDTSYNLLYLLNPSSLSHSLSLSLTARRGGEEEAARGGGGGGGEESMRVNKENNMNEINNKSKLRKWVRGEGVGMREQTLENTGKYWNNAGTTLEY